MVQYDNVTRARIDSERPGRSRCRAGRMRPRGSGRLPLTLPRDSRITSVYGGAREYNGQVTSRHTGTDFAGAVGTPVRRGGARSGRAGGGFLSGGTGGLSDHGAGLVTGYFHLSQAAVAAGDTVAAGSGSAPWGGAGG